MTIAVGVDTGGTFTDFVVTEAGGVRVHKVLSTPDDPARAVVAGLRELFPGAFRGRLTYGSTVATNALLERRGARVCLVTTAGFEDVIEIGRQARPALYALEPRVPAPLVARADRVGARERMSYEGEVLMRLSAGAIRSVVRRVRDRCPEAIAVALLHSYADGRHERALGRALAVLGVPVTLSHVLVREHREYERTSTAVVNAYVAPLMTRHLGRLAAAVPPGRLMIMQSNGGAVTPRLAQREPVRTVLSGPAGGVVGATRIAAHAGLERIVTFDMGGTSTDVALVDGALPQRSDWALDGMAVRVPVLDIHTVGAGGGSIARRDAGDCLAVGPQSAGANPGPACYGRGDAATVTDANLVLGRLDADRFLGGRMRLDVERARGAVDAVARSLGLSRIRTAEGIVRVANAAMARALRTISIERGRDPRAYTLVAYGGAAGLHACELAADLGMSQVLIPRDPGLLSAAGMADAPVARDYVVTVRRVDPSSTELARRFAVLQREGMAELRREGIPSRSLVARRLVRVRYLGQAHEIEVPFDARFRARFAQEHARLYGYAADRPLEILALHLALASVAPSSRPSRRRLPRRAAPLGEPWHVTWRGRRLAVRRHARDDLVAGTRLAGPALLVEFSSTVLIPPAWSGRVDENRHLWLRRQADVP